MNGILVVDKLQGWTSQDIITKIKKTLEIIKIGHAGTLDPLATGVLVVLLNQATKLSDYFLNDDKEYLCEIVIGEATATEDREGEVTLYKEVTSLPDVDNVLNLICGNLMQVPPMYSAIRHQGRKLYQLAREGIEVKRKARQVQIHDLKRTSKILYQDHKAIFSFQAKVSKGTYLRTLCVEIGKRLGYPAHMKSLRRLRSGNFSLTDANKMPDILKGKLNIINMLDALKKYEIINIDEKLLKNIYNGKQIHLESQNAIVVLAYQGNLVAIYERENNYFKAKRIWK